MNMELQQQPVLSVLQGAHVSSGSVHAILFFFMVYAFGGWLLENVYSKATTGVFLKEGFLFGPFKPMYGFAPVFILLYAERGASWGIVLLLCLIVPTGVEYISGMLLQKGIHRQYWDYSGFRLQLHGHICLSFSLCWMLLSLAVIWILHPYVAALYIKVEPIWRIFGPLWLLYVLSDAGWSVWVRRQEAHLLAGD
ncbi:putative ABC transporter permease [Paenibacillus sp. ACRRX]|uniref:putative ABC transporter permease n=1 Tax=Paenibacillus sp. ACRRX TaxID=2918206 RepID=UPI001EF64699|nr:putative ABC transporter permease [Paenibacillus sp. ACRRX]MCG7408677.1 putative ABC transporter permease [Paenibacillus sp. ACRRX]